MVPAASCFTATGDLDRAAFQSNIDAYVGHGVDGVLVAGSSGESALLDDEDRRQLLTWARARLSDDQWLLAGVGSESTRQTISRAHDAKAAGANAALVISPHYFLKRMTEPALLAHFADHFVSKGQTPITFTTDFIEALKDYAWPGNVRELSNLVDRFNTLFSGQLLSLATVPSSLLPKGLRKLQAERVSTPIVDSLEIVAPINDKDLHHSANADVMNPFANPAPPLAMDLHNEVEDIIMLAQGLPSLPPEGLSLKDRLADIERDLIVQALNRTDGNVSQTARLLNLQRTTLIEKLNKYDLRQGTLPVASSDAESGLGT